MEPLDLKNINIFSNPMYMKIWGHMFSKYCGSEKNSIKPNNIKLQLLIDKFISDYNEIGGNIYGKNTNRNST